MSERRDVSRTEGPAAKPVGDGRDAVDKELTSAARGGAVTFGGSMFSTLMGFVLAIVLARQLGAGGSGVVLQTIAAFMISLAIARVGMDTTAVWILPRLTKDDPDDVGRAVSSLLLSAFVGGVLVAAAWYGVAALAAGGPFRGTEVTTTLSAVAWAVPLASVMLVGLAATRGFGGVLPFNLIGNIGAPGLRPVLVLAATALGGSLVSAAVAWALPFVLGVLATLVLLYRLVRKFAASQGRAVSFVPTWRLQRRLLGFGLPRTVSSALEQSIIWFDVVLVGLIAGPAAAGVYGATSRFVGAGVVVLTALRVVVAPRFSALLVRQQTEDLRHLYRVTASWILLFGTPAYILLAVFAPTVLSWLGEEFVAGATAMIVLSVGALFLLAGGNVQSLLLMSGHSGWSAINRAVVFSVNVTLNIFLIPVYGVTGAAVAWAMCMALDTTLAFIQVRRFTGVTPAASSLSRVLAAAVVATIVPALLALAWLGQTTAGLLVATPSSLAVALLYAFLDRKNLRLTLLADLLPIPRRRGSGAA